MSTQPDSKLQHTNEITLLNKLLTHYNLFLSEGTRLYAHSSTVDKATEFLKKTMAESNDFQPEESRLFIKDLKCTPEVYTYSELTQIFNRHTEVLKKYTKLTHISDALSQLTLNGGRRRKTKRVSKRLRKSKKFHKRK